MLEIEALRWVYNNTRSQATLRKFKEWNWRAMPFSKSSVFQETVIHKCFLIILLKSREKCLRSQINRISFLNIFEAKDCPNSSSPKSDLFFSRGMIWIQCPNIITLKIAKSLERTTKQKITSILNPLPINCNITRDKSYHILLCLNNQPLRSITHLILN